MLNNPSPLTWRIIALSSNVKKLSTASRGLPAPIFCNALLRSMQQSELVVQQRPTLAVRFNGRLISEHTPDFVAHDKSGETVVICLISSYQTKPEDVVKAQACLDACRESASGLLINFGDEKLLWSLLIHLYLHQVQAEPTQVLFI